MRGLQGIRGGPQSPPPPERPPITRTGTRPESQPKRLKTSATQPQTDDTTDDVPRELSVERTESANAYIDDGKAVEMAEDPTSSLLQYREDTPHPLQPEKFYFGPEQYTRRCKIGSRCHVKETVNLIKSFPDESEWFTHHSQFRHIFHMAEEPNRKPTGMWMLLLHQASTGAHNELWFVVNGVPITYSIKEHALLCGLDCHDYPINYNELRDKKKGGFKFVKRMFGNNSHIKVQDVKDKLLSLGSCLDKKKMCVLYFLCNVLRAKSGVRNCIDPFLLKVVDNLSLCQAFPWGRYTFDANVVEVKSMMKKFKSGIVKDRASWIFSGFSLPLEAFAFECIPVLGREFRVDVAAGKDCPRLCKRKFTDTFMKGYPLEDINDAIGRTKDIVSILEPDSDEEDLMERIIDIDCVDGIGYIDPIVDGWTNHLIGHGRKIFWEDLYDIELAARGLTENGYQVPIQETVNTASLSEMQAAMDREVNDLKERLQNVEHFLKDHIIKGHETGASTRPANDVGEGESASEDKIGENEEHVGHNGMASAAPSHRKWEGKREEKRMKN